MASGSTRVTTNGPIGSTFGRWCESHRSGVSLQVWHCGPGARRLLVFVGGILGSAHRGSILELCQRSPPLAGTAQAEMVNRMMGKNKCESDDTSSITPSSSVSPIGFFHIYTCPQSLSDSVQTLAATGLTRDERRTVDLQRMLWNRLVEEKKGGSERINERETVMREQVTEVTSVSRGSGVPVCICSPRPPCPSHLQTSLIFPMQNEAECGLAVPGAQIQLQTQTSVLKSRWTYFKGVVS
ncbi:hypothetical protein F2P79_021787 [Pimephales promelas]|nr:hypothetical protein F2P79_021787 [Pimephales promelas]